jgi:hypothetical protein
MTDLEYAANSRNLPLANRQRRMLAAYLLNRKRGVAAVRKMIRDDINRFNDLGARGYASELAEVLTRFSVPLPEMAIQSGGHPNPSVRDAIRAEIHDQPADSGAGLRSASASPSLSTSARRAR